MLAKLLIKHFDKIKQMSAAQIEAVQNTGLQTFNKITHRTILEQNVPMQTKYLQSQHANTQKASRLQEAWMQDNGLTIEESNRILLLDAATYREMRAVLSKLTADKDIEAIKQLHVDNIDELLEMNVEDLEVYVDMTKGN